MKIHKIINIKLNRKKYRIEYKQNKNILYFNDKNGGSIGFVKKGQQLSVFVNDKYSNSKMWKKYPRLKGINAYTLSPKQMKIFFKWFQNRD